MKSIVWLILAATAGAGAALIVTLVCSNAELRRSVEGLRTERQADLAKVEALGAELRQAKDDLARQVFRSEELSRSLLALDERASETRDVDPSRRQAAQARVFAGRQALGTAWVLTGGATTNAAGVTAAEPAVLLDEAVVRAINALQARAAAGEAPPRELTVNYNYANPAGGWNGWWPAYWIPDRPFPTNAPPGVNPPSQSPNLPPPNSQLGNTGIWRPTEKPFLPSPSPWPIVTPQNRAGGRSIAPSAPSAPSPRAVVHSGSASSVVIRPGR